MNQTDFTYILQHPQAISHEQTEAVKSIIDRFPYFQAARAIHLKGLKNQSSILYNQELKTTAAYTTDRSILFDYITSEAFIQNEISKAIKRNTESLKGISVNVEDISVNRSVTIDDILKQQIKDTDGVLDPALFEPKEYRPKKFTGFKLDESEEIENTNNENKTQEATAEDLLNLGQPLQFDKKETHSFNEWLKLSKFKPIQREQEVEPSTQQETPDKDSPSKGLAKSEKFQLIDKFIAKNPKITPNKTAPSKGNLANAQMIQPEALMTETLARIYVEQKNYKKAIQSYKILSLKYPEKSSFFANQIKAVEHIQEQNNRE
ncbi:hypothetical protein [Algibacter pectinivorans]|uniref:Tetratricopeptide repeat-containing protein n=1 Tax=Algibacter pectinivorans TaxID=870482 RepID=A0A1I1PRB0_9FLAO|nr:hypothetical protein [Algibacter pectinivorans]SFD12265.1 hypothetical protein SAMN04487987_104155 [Algibacter pectinivorans]